MKFGPVPVERAAGHILAHSVPLPGGRLRKGMTLGAGELAALKAAGWTRITVARLEPGVGALGEHGVDGFAGEGHGRWLLCGRPGELLEHVYGDMF